MTTAICRFQIDEKGTRAATPDPKVCGYEGLSAPKAAQSGMPQTFGFDPVVTPAIS